MDTRPCLRPSVLGVSKYLASAQQPSSRKPLPAIYCILNPCVFTLTCCMRVCRILHFSRFLCRPWDRLSSFLRTAKPSCCHTIGTSSIGSWLALLQLFKCGCARLTHSCPMVRTPDIWAALERSRSAETLPLPRSLIYVNETDVLQPQTMCKTSSRTFGIVEPSLNPASLAVVLEWCPYIQSQSVLSVLLQCTPPLSCTSRPTTLFLAFGFLSRVFENTGVLLLEKKTVAPCDAATCLSTDRWCYSRSKNLSFVER